VTTQKFIDWRKHKWRGDIQIAPLKLIHIFRREEEELSKSEDCSDESIGEPLRKFTVGVHNVIMDTLVDSIDRRFLLQNSSLFVDLSFLSPINFPCVIEGTP